MKNLQTIINIKGAAWKHQLLMGIVRRKKIPAGLRAFYFLKKIFGLNLLSFQTPSGLKLLLDYDDYVQENIYYNGNYEPQSVALFKLLAKNATVIFDIGAHIGQYALECAQDDVPQTKRIFAIEVNPKTFTYLLNNIQLNQFAQVTPVMGAVAGEHTILNINIPSYWNAGNTQINDSTEGAGFDNYLAPAFSITSLLKRSGLNHIDLVKIDVEGHEHEVLNDLFKAGIYPKDILFEFIPDAFAGAAALPQLLQQQGYILKDINGVAYTNQTELPELNLWASFAGK